MNLLFDLDGTLTDPKEGIVLCIRFAMEQLGCPLEENFDLDWCIGPPLLQSLKVLLKGQENKAKEALELYRQRFVKKGIFENEVYPGIHDALKSLCTRHSLFVATSKPRVFAAKIVEHFGLTRYFDGTYGSELDGENSDKADLISRILLENELESKTTSMLGDREHDIVGAIRNKVTPIGVLWGYGSRLELESAGAKALLATPAELLQYFC
jgi:phosphoglycolate phosphatase